MKEKFKKEIKNIEEIKNCKFRNKDAINPSKNIVESFRKILKTKQINQNN